MVTYDIDKAKGLRMKDVGVWIWSSRGAIPYADPTCKYIYYILSSERAYQYQEVPVMRVLSTLASLSVVSFTRPRSCSRTRGSIRPSNLSGWNRSRVSRSLSFRDLRIAPWSAGPAVTFGTRNVNTDSSVRNSALGANGEDSCGKVGHGISSKVRVLSANGSRRSFQLFS